MGAGSCPFCSVTGRRRRVITQQQHLHRPVVHTHAHSSRPQQGPSMVSPPASRGAETFSLLVTEIKGLKDQKI